MFTYLCIDPVRKNHYVGSTIHNGGKRPFAQQKEGMFVFVSDDDGCSDRRLEQSYLDFYHGTPWCWNKSEMVEGHRPERWNRPNSSSTRKKKSDAQKQLWQENYVERSAAIKRGCQSPLAKKNRRKAGKLAALVRFGKNGFYPQQCEFRTALSETFIHYATEFEP